MGVLGNLHWGLTQGKGRMGPRGRQASLGLETGVLGQGGKVRGLAPPGRSVLWVLQGPLGVVGI